MSERTSVPADSAWHNVGTRPATAQLISVGTPGMLVCASGEPSGNDGLVLINQGDCHTFQLANTIWAQAVAGAAIVAVLPE